MRGFSRAAIRWVRVAGWWISDYAYAVYWQTAALVGSRKAESYRTGSLRPIVVIPGIWETWQFMRPLIRRLHEAGYPVYVLASLGRNDQPVVESARAVADFVLRENLTDVLIVAHSKGGLIGKYAMALLNESGRLAAMVAVCAPFSGSRYANYLVLPSLRALSPRDPTTVLLARNQSVNARITSIYGTFDPHIPAGSELIGARNIKLDTGGHFRILSAPHTLTVLLETAKE